MSESPLALAKKLLTAGLNKDLDEAVTYVTDDCEYTNMPMGSVTGPEGIKAVLGPFFAPTIATDFTVVREMENGSMCMIERVDRHHLPDPDRWIELPVVAIFEVRDGKSSVWRDYFDLPTIMNDWPSA